MLKSRFGQFLFVFMFCGAIVLIGSKELSRRYAGKSMGRPMKDMVKTLRGEVDMEAPRASLGRKPTFERPAAQSAGGHVDQLDRKDKLELRNLLEKVAP